MPKQTRTPAQVDVLAQLSGFISRYLQCSEHQCTVLALWILHTYCYSAAQVTPYLSIQSAYKQSGKTLCLQLLNLLCENPALSVGFTPANLALRIRLKPSSAILLDECQATLGTRSRTKALALRALLASSFNRGFGFSGPREEHSLFCPKAFAGMGQLPQELADRSISVILEPLGVRTFLGYGPDLEDVRGAKPPASRSYVEQPPSATWGAFDLGLDSPTRAAFDFARDGAELPVTRFNLSQATKEAQPLKQSLSAWAKDNLSRLKQLPGYSQEDFPPNLSPRRQDLCEPLLQLADTVGGLWPARARQSLAAVFEQEAAFDLQPALQLLADIRHCFQFHSNPERLSTSTLMDWMRTLPARPWDADGPLTPRTFARLLLAFDIRPRLQRLGEEGPARGYQLHDFLEPWRRHLGAAPILKFPPVLPPDNRRSEEPNGAQPFIAPASLERQDLDLAARNQKLESVPLQIQHQDSQIFNNDSPCNAIPELCTTNGTRHQIR